MKKKWILVAALAAALLIALLVFLGSRTLGSPQSPSFTGIVTDIRVTMKPATNLSGDDDTDCYKVYFGYQMDGQWTDLPETSFPFFCDPDVCGVGGGVHCKDLHRGNLAIIPMGNRVLISLPGTPEDAQGFQLLEPVWEKAPEKSHELAAVITSNSLWQVSYGQYGLDDRHYLILDVENLPENPQLTYLICEDAHHDHEEDCHRTLTARTIRCAIAYLEELQGITPEPSDQALLTQEPVVPEYEIEGMEFPDFSKGTVTDVRITTRKVVLPEDHPWQTEDNGSMADRNYVQICYGYEMDGVWYDYPAEFYDLRNLYSGTTGNKVVWEDHVVRIGDFVLISMLDQEGKTPLTLKDTRNTQVQYPLADLPEDADHYVYFLENVETGTGNSNGFYPMKSRAYLVLPLEDIEGDYVLTYVFHDLFQEEPEERHINSKILWSLLSD